MQYPIFSSRSSWSPMRDLRREMDRLFDDYSGPSGSAADWNPACDVQENEDHYLISLELAGVPKEQVEIEFHDGQLVISGERTQTSKHKEGAQWYSERRYGKFQRAFTLPTGIEEDKLEARFDDGVLQVYVPKPAVMKPRQVKIQSGSDAGKGFFARLRDARAPGLTSSRKDSDVPASDRAV